MKICVISGNRADHAALTPVAQALDASWIFVDTLPSRDRYDSAIGCAQAMMTAADQFERAKPDLVIVAGDRFEILGASCAAHLMSIPIAHLSGGDITEGSQDDSTRHAITKLASIHFPTNQASADHLVSMGEEKWRIHMVGAPQIDYLLTKTLYSREETIKLLAFTSTDTNNNFVLVAYQPPTMTEDLTELDDLLDKLRKQGWPCIFTTVNPDAGGREVERKIIKFCLPGVHKIVKMDNKLFLSAMKHCTYMVGNSSSGFYEAPTLGTVFQNIGNRQNGRSPVTGDGKAAQRIKSTLDALMLIPKKLLLQKKCGEQCSTQPGSGSTVSESGAATPKKSSSDGPSLESGLSAVNLNAYSTSDQGRDRPLGF